MANKFILDVKNLSKIYKGTHVLNNINIALEEGKIYGLIGLNGAGKTTLMKAIAGFVKPEEGRIVLFGQDGEKNLKDERKRIGCLIQSTGILKNMTAEENLEFHRILKGKPNKEIIEELLEIVNLKEVKDKRVSTYSLGMKQKLEIAITLMGNPELLILDEPINGLDPKAIIEFREIIKKLNEEKHITIFISSHILRELYMLASHYIILHKGEIKEHITHEEIDEKCKKYLLLSSSTPEKMAYVIENSLKTRNYRVMSDKSIQLYNYIDDKEYVARVFMDEKVLVTNLSCECDSLEDYFMRTIGGNHV